MASIFEGLIAREAYSLRANVRTATTSDLDSVGNGTWVTGTQTLTAGAAGTTTIDTILVADGDRILVKNQVAGIENGVYEVSDASAGSPTVFTRTSDIETGEEASGSFLFMNEGAVNAQTGWICTNVLGSGIVDTDALTWVQFDVINTLSVARGGTGATSFTNNEIVLGQGTSPLTTVTSANNAIMVTNGSGTPSFSTTLPTGLTVEFEDDKFTISDNADSTSKLQFTVDPVATATTIQATIFPTSDTIAGIASTQTLTNKFLDSNTYDELLDVNGLEMIIFNATGSAVNEFTFTNAATGANPSIVATGGDANVGLDFGVKGTGKYNFNATADGPAELRLFEDTDNGTNYIGIDVPAAVTTSLTYTLPGTDGSSGDVITTDGTGNLSFVTPSTGRVAYHLIASELVANKTSYTTIAFFAWSLARYSSYASGALIYEVDVGNRDLDIRLYDATNAAVIVADLGVNADGFRVVTGLSNPASNARIELQVRKSAGGGINPRIFGVQLEFAPS